MPKYPFIQKVAEAIAIADNQDVDDWYAYEELAIAAIKAIKEHFDAQKVREQS